MKPIIRWTIGSSNIEGLKCLKQSIMWFYKLYGSNFNYYVMYNSGSKPAISFDFVELIDQNNFVNSLLCKPSGVAWKLYPPRINVQTPEIFIDNDLIIYKELDEIDELIYNNIAFIAEDYYRGFYGNYKHLISENIDINSGFFGLPRGFDFRSKIVEICGNRIWDNFFDEQGVVAVAVSSLEKFNIIARSKLSMLSSYDGHDSKFGSHGVHFTGLNTDASHKWWQVFKETRIKGIF